MQSVYRLAAAQPEPGEGVPSTFIRGVMAEAE